MKCDNCNNNEATVHLTEIEGDEKRELHLCDECYREKASPAKKIVEFADLLKTLLTGAVKEQGAAANALCPTCGISLAEFRATGRFGCPNDYNIFREPISTLLEKIQHGVRHVGGVPTQAGAALQGENELIRLRRDLERAVQREEYEQAAGLRDRIRELTENAHGTD